MKNTREYKSGLRQGLKLSEQAFDYTSAINKVSIPKYIHKKQDKKQHDLFWAGIKDGFNEGLQLRSAATIRKTDRGEIHSFGTHRGGYLVVGFASTGMIQRSYIKGRMFTTDEIYRKM